MSLTWNFVALPNAAIKNVKNHKKKNQLFKSICVMSMKLCH